MVRHNQQIRASDKSQQKQKEVKKMMCSLDKSRAEYRRRMSAHKAARKATQNDNAYKPKSTNRKVTCRYCKAEGHKVGHFDKSLGCFVTTCVKALESTAKKQVWNKKKRDRTGQWKDEISKTVAEETGGGGWDTAGSSDKTGMTLKKEKPVLKFAKNPFALDAESDESDDDDDVERQKKVARRAAKEAREAAAKVAPKPRNLTVVTGAWKGGAPTVGSEEVTVDWKEEEVPEKVELLRAPRRTTTPTESSDDETNPELTRSSGGPPSPTSPAPEFWGDEC